MKRLSKKQAFQNAENNYLSYLKQFEMMLASHAEYRKTYGKTPEVEANFKKEVDVKERKLKEFKKRMEQMKAALLGE